MCSGQGKDRGAEIRKSRSGAVFTIEAIQTRASHRKTVALCADRPDTSLRKTGLLRMPNQLTDCRNREPLLRTNSLVQNFAGLLGRGARVGDFPFHLAGTNFILRDAAGFPGTGIDHRRSTGLQLASAPRRHENVPVITIEAFDQLHWDSPLKTDFDLVSLERQTIDLLAERSGFRSIPRDDCSSGSNAPFRRPMK
jgi:hypothetical protein